MPQEIKAGMIEGLKIKQTFLQNELQDGDVLTYQVEMTEKECVLLEHTMIGSKLT